MQQEKPRNRDQNKKKNVVAETRNQEPNPKNVYIEGLE